MTPGNLGPKTIKLLKSLKIMKIDVFFYLEKMCITILRREHWTTAPDHWYGHFGSKLCFWELVKSVKIIKIGSILGTSQMVLKDFRNLSIFFENFGSEPCARPLGYGRLGDSFKPLVLALRRALRGFFPSKKHVPQQNNACLLRKYSFLARFLLFWQMLT